LIVKNAKAKMRVYVSKLINDFFPTAFVKRHFSKSKKICNILVWHNAGVEYDIYKDKKVEGFYALERFTGTVYGKHFDGRAHCCEKQLANL